MCLAADSSNMSTDQHAGASTVTKPGIESSRRRRWRRVTDIAKAIGGRNECTRMPSDSATSKQAAAERSIKRETRPTRYDAKAVRPMGDAGEVTEAPPLPHTVVTWFEGKERGPGPVCVIKCQSVRVRVFRAIDVCCSIFRASLTRTSGCRVCLLAGVSECPLFKKQNNNKYIRNNTRWSVSCISVSIKLYECCLQTWT